MQRIKLVLFSCLLMMGIAVKAQDTTVYSKLSLKQSIDIALANNIPVKQTGLAVERAQVDRNQAKANLLPSFNANFNYGFNTGRTIDPITNSYINQQLQSSSLGITGGVLLFNGFQLQNFIKQTGYALDASKMDYQQAKDNLALNVVLAYLLVLNNHDQLDIARNQAVVTSKQVERMGVLVKEGAVGQYQLSDLKGNYAGDQINIVNAQNNLAQSKLNFCQLLNIPYNPDLELESEFILPAEKYPLTAGEVYNLGIQNLPLVKAADYRVKSSDKLIKAIRGDFYPSIFAQGNFSSSYSNAATSQTPGAIVETTTGDYVKIAGLESPVFTKQQQFSSDKIGYFTQLDNNRGSFYGLFMQIPIFNNFTVRNRVKTAKINMKDAELAAANTRVTLRQNVEQAWQNMSSAFDRYKVLLDQVSNYEESFRAAEIRFNAGAINSTDYLIVKNALDRAKENLAQAKYEFIIRNKVLDYYQGKPIAD
jgi:outer membrane protein